MRRSKPKEHKPEKVEDVWGKAVDSMCLSLDRFGPSETLRILLEHSHKDKICRELLAILPGMIETGNFLRRFRFTIKTSRRLFQKLRREHSIL